MDSENVIKKKIKEQLDKTRVQYEESKQGLDNVVDSFIVDIGRNLKQYVAENVKRSMRKEPDAAAGMDDASIENLRSELAGVLEPEVDRVVAELRDCHSWYDGDTVFLDLDSPVWRIIKSIEKPANEVIARYGVAPINMKNWTWLSPELDNLITMGFSANKKDFIDKRKQLKYLENRYEEESRLGAVLQKLDSL